MNQTRSTETGYFKMLISEYADKQQETCFLNMEAIKESFQEDAVHDFRVGVKRLRVLMWFLSHFDTRLNPEASLSNERKFFKLLSPIRDFQVQQKLLNTEAQKCHLSVAGLETHIDKKLQKAQLKFDALKDSFVPTLNPHLVQVPLSYALSDTTILNTANRLLRDIFIQIRNHLPDMLRRDEPLHDARKDLKKVVYLAEILKMPYLVIGKKKISVKDFKELQESLGKAHDYIVGRNIVMKYLRKKQKSSHKYQLFGQEIEKTKMLEADNFKNQFYRIMENDNQPVDIRFGL
jgi:CHAD domain-containing protein